jgi:hypothetical protein
MFVVVVLPSRQGDTRGLTDGGRVTSLHQGTGIKIALYECVDDCVCDAPCEDVMRVGEGSSKDKGGSNE